MKLTSGFKRPFKGNPQQGTLFQASAQELDPTGQRYPRGYNPERQREVHEAVGEVGYSSFGERRDASGDAQFPILLSEDEFGESDPVTKRDWGEGRAVIRDAVARSTVPMDVVERTRFAVTPNISANGFYGPKDETVYFGRSAEEAAQHRAGFGTGYPTPESQRLNQGQSVIHELGHSADPEIAPLRGQRNVIMDRMGELPVEGYTEPRDLGRAEEFADDFAAEHFRHDPRAGRRETFAVETGMYPGAAPNDIPPRHLAGYSSWGERSQAAAADLQPRHEVAEERGERYPQTSDQSREVENLRRVAAERSPRLFQGNRPHPDVI